MEFRILGPLEALDEGVSLPLGGAKQRALLAILLLRANEVVSTDGLIDALWDDPPAAPTKAVQVYVSRLRKALRGKAPTSRAPGYLVEVLPEQLDLTRFRQLLDEARVSPARAVDKLEEALALWRGPALAEFTSEPFARIERLRLEELRLEAMEERIEAELMRGRHASLAGELEALVAAHPLRERLRGQLMLVLYRCGRQAEALAAYRDGRRELVEELGIEPGRELQELEQAILRHDPSLDPVARAADASPSPPEPAARDGDERDAPTEERKVVSVLYAEAVAVGTAARLSDPEDVRRALRPFRELAKRQVESHGGTIDRFIGDAVLALFGARVAHEDDPERAVRAALAIRRFIAQEAEGLEVRIGVDTGLALVSFDPQARDREAIAAGDVVKTVQRIEGAAPLGYVLVGRQTQRATRHAIEYREAAPVEAAERFEPIAVWEALEARSRSAVGLVPEPRTPLVGRQHEVDLLVSTLARVREERSPELVTLVGVPGIGKSRLVLELFEAGERDRSRVTWRQGRCLPYGDGVSLWALGEVVKAQAGILESDSPGEAEAKLRRTVGEVVTESQEAPWVEEQLRPLVGSAGELGSGELSGDAFAAWRRFLEDLAHIEPLVLVLEDLHWADEVLLAFVDELVDRARDAPLLVLCTARPELFERRPGWGGGKANALTISLAPLSDAETGEIVRAVLGQSGAGAAVREALLARAAGNPLYAEQFARVLAELGELEELPGTVHGIIAARLDGLLPPEKALLQDASVVGKVFWLGAIEAIGGVSRTQAEELLYGLERKEFVQRARRSAVAGQAELAFRHVLLRDVAYEQIPRAARGEKHRRVAEWIESLGRPEDHAEMLTHHYVHAVEYAGAAGPVDPALAERARLALRAAGDRALALASYAAAARYYRAALDVWPEDDRGRAWLLVHAGRARHAAEGSGIDLLRQGFEELRAQGDADGAAEAAVELGRCLGFGGDRDAAYSYVDQALELAGSGARSTARAHALVARAAYHMIASEHPQAIRLAQEALPLTEALGIPELRVRALDVRGLARALSGDVGGLEDSRQAIALAREHNAFSYLLWAEVNLHMAQFAVGQADAASDTLRMFGRDVERYGATVNYRWWQGAEANQAVLQGRWDDALGALDALIGQAEAGVADYLEPAFRVARASIELARGNLERASRDTERALCRARRTKDPQLLAPALAFRAVVLLAQGLREEAWKLAAEVLVLGAVPLGPLLELFPTAVNPVHLAWLAHDLGHDADLLAVLEFAPATPWFEAARAVASGDFAGSVDIVAEIGAPSVDAYARLRAAEGLARAGHVKEAREQLEAALPFFRKAGATRYLSQATELLATAG
jgi:DNA-binding SARP family transcriptional activator